MTQDLSRRLNLWVIGSLLAGGSLVLALLVILGVCIARDVDHAGLLRETRLVEHGLREKIETVTHDQESITIWDAAVVHARLGDQRWLAENVSVWMGDYFGHDRVYLLNPAGALIHAMRDGSMVFPPTFNGDDAALINDLAVRLRSEMQERTTGLFDSTEALAETALTGVAAIGGRPAAIGLRPIIPDSPQIEQRPGTEFIHVSVVFLDGPVPAAISERYQLRDVRYVAQRPEDGLAQVPVTASQGETLGYFTWEPVKAGQELLMRLAPLTIGGLLLCALTVAALIRGLYQASTALQGSEAHSRFLAFHDPLTGLPNRALFEDRLDRGLAQIRRRGSMLGLLYIDIDRFKNINDTLGHRAGDELIIETAARLRRAVREVDTVARMGGDEFAVVLTSINSVRVAEHLASRLLAAIAMPVQVGDEEIVASASIGIALAPEAGLEREELTRKADIALYEAKRRGRANYRVFAADMDDMIRQRREVEAALRTALEQGRELSLAYQPLYAVADGSLVGAEALLRWSHPVHGRLPAGLVIEIAEEANLITQLGEFVLREACGMLGRLPVPWIAVNVSPVQFRDPRLANRYLRIINEMGVSPDRLQIEITETVLLEHTDLVGRQLNAFRAHGMRVALDDFGTGYSSMNYIRTYAVDKLKIDRSFVQNLATDTEAQSLVKAMLDMAHALRIKVTAEGVETAEQLAVLRALGCEEVQGYLFSKPLPASAFEKLVAAEAFMDQSKRHPAA